MVEINAVGRGFRELNDIRNTKVSKLYPFHSITVTGFSVAKIGSIVGITGSGSTNESIVDILVIDTGGHIAGIPDTVLFGIGQVHLVYGQRAFGLCVNGGDVLLHSGRTDWKTQAQQKCQTQGDCFGNVFHMDFPFRKN